MRSTASRGLRVVRFGLVINIYQGVLLPLDSVEVIILVSSYSRSLVG